MSELRTYSFSSKRPVASIASSGHGPLRWSPSFTTAAISRQQGADLAEAFLDEDGRCPKQRALELFCKGCNNCRDQLAQHRATGAGIVIPGFMAQFLSRLTLLCCGGLKSFIYVSDIGQVLRASKGIEFQEPRACVETRERELTCYNQCWTIRFIPSSGSCLLVHIAALQSPSPHNFSEKGC